MKLVNIVLATYKPNMEYFHKLLGSLNVQSYQSVNLIVRDDSEDEIIFQNICNEIKQEITNFSYEIHRNLKNIGSNRTFELLTLQANGDYIAYCDQDDFWERDKISKLVERIEYSEAVLCYSDLSVIDKNDKLIAKSFKDLHKRLNHIQGDNLFENFLRRNSVTGCTMLIKSEVAKSSIPFCNEYYVHDHWLTLYASSIGKITYVNEPLIRYRIHGDNQIGANILIGIEGREDYYKKKLLKEKEKYKVLLDKYNFNKEQKKSIIKILNWTEERIKFFENKGFKNTLLVLKRINEDYQLVVLELIINLTSEKISKLILKKIKS